MRLRFNIFFTSRFSSRYKRFYVGNLRGNRHSNDGDDVCKGLRRATSEIPSIGSVTRVRLALDNKKTHSEKIRPFVRILANQTRRRRGGVWVSRDAVPTDGIGSISNCHTKRLPYTCTSLWSSISVRFCSTAAKRLAWPLRHQHSDELMEQANFIRRVIVLFAFAAFDDGDETVVSRYPWTRFCFLNLPVGSSLGGH